MSKQKNTIPCPICGNERLCDKGINARVVAQKADVGHRACDLYLKCWKCKAEVGLKKIA